MPEAPLLNGRTITTASGHSSLGYKTPADFAGTIAATGSNAAQDENFAFPPVAHTAPIGVFKNAGALVAAG